jgi:transposase-like protein
MFDKCKFPLLFAFHIAFKICTKKKGMSSLELSEEYGLRQKTCWEFKWKIQQAMKSSGKHPLTGEVHVDEFYVGGEEEGIIGRNTKGKKKLVIVALEIVKGGVGRAYAQVIDDASATSFRPFFEKYISKDATIVTDEWNGYKPLMRDYNIEQRRSDDGKAFPQMHIHIMNIKGWLRGIHHHCSKERMQGYLDEYHFRFNRRVHMDTIFDVLTRRMVSNQPTRL